MSEDPGGAGTVRTIRTARLEAFSDGVFAIAVTLLVLELAVPAGAEEDLLAALAHQWPSYLAYVVSFASVGAVWVMHSAITEHLERADAVLVRLNLLLLMVVSFLPFPTKLLAEFVSQQGAERVAVTVYGVNLLLASALVAVVWRYALHAHLVRADLSDDDARMLTKRTTPGLSFYGVMLAVGLIVPVVAVFGYLAIALYLIFPLALLKGRRR